VRLKERRVPPACEVATHSKPPPPVPLPRCPSPTVARVGLIPQCTSPPMPTATNRSWVGLSSLSATGYPNGGPWRQFHCIACGGYAFETYGTILHGKRVPADLVAAVGRRVNTVCKHEVDLRQQLVVFHMYHNLRLPHSSICQALFQPKATSGTGSVKSLSQ
jgi:hypothetical protein